jgi:hypothetical protein
MKTVVFAAVACAASLLASDAFAAGMSTALNDLLGKDPGASTAYSCFVRHYDAAHLSAHPKQNVRDIKVFVESTYDTGQDPDYKRSNNMTIGYRFKGLDTPIATSGSCYGTVEGQVGIIECGVDCDGGHFDVSAKGKDGLTLSIPDGVSMYDATPGNDDPPGDLPKAATLGADDKTFALDRVDNKQCQDIMSDQAKFALLGIPLPKDDGDAASTDAPQQSTAASK